MDKNAEKYGKTITQEMGKPINEAIDEVKKAAKHCRYYADIMDTILKPEPNVESSFKKSYVEYHPLGPLFFCSPFNFPLWLVCKGGIPALAMGNVLVVKIASQCVQTGKNLQEAFNEGGFGNGEVTIVFTEKDQSEFVIKNKKIRAVSFTGSATGGSNIAQLAGKYCKKSVMELGGSDPFVVFDDADLDEAAESAAMGRLKNSG